MFFVKYIFIIVMLIVVMGETPYRAVEEPHAPLPWSRDLPLGTYVTLTLVRYGAVSSQNIEAARTRSAARAPEGFFDLLRELYPGLGPNSLFGAANGLEKILEQLCKDGFVKYQDDATYKLTRPGLRLLARADRLWSAADGCRPPRSKTAHRKNGRPNR